MKKNKKRSYLVENSEKNIENEEKNILENMDEQFKLNDSLKSDITVLPDEMPVLLKEPQKEKIVLLFQRTYIGNDRRKTELLLKFFENLVVLNKRNLTIIFIQDAVKLAVFDEKLKKNLELLETKGNTIIIESEALQEYEIYHRCKIGKILQLLEIQKILMSDLKVISL